LPKPSNFLVSEGVNTTLWESPCELTTTPVMTAPKMGESGKNSSLDVGPEDFDANGWIDPTVVFEVSGAAAEEDNEVIKENAHSSVDQLVSHPSLPAMVSTLPGANNNDLQCLQIPDKPDLIREKTIGLPKNGPN